MKTLCAVLLAFMVTFAILSPPAQAIPAFGRKYGFNCSMCHTAYPKLNDFGQRVRDDGYQIPGQEGREENVFQSQLSLALRTTTGISLYRQTGQTTAGFNLYGLDLLSAGVLHRNIGYLVIYPPRVDEPAADYRGPLGGTNPSQPGTIESGSIVFSNIIPNALNLRVGRFEPAYHGFSAPRSLYVMEPYEVYDYSPTGNEFVFGDNQIGLEATGRFRNGFRYGLGVVNGNGGNPDNNLPKDFYLRLSQVLGGGEGQSAGQRIGVFAYQGWRSLGGPRATVAPTGENEGSGDKPFSKLGADLSLNWSTLNLEVLYLMGIEDKSLNFSDPTKRYSYSGGFAELDWATLMNNRLVASGLYNWVRPTTLESAQKVDALSVLLRYYLGDWTAVNVALHAEYTHRQTGTDNPTSEDLFTALVDFGF